MRPFDVPSEALVRLRAFHASVDRSTARLAAIHEGRLRCRLGCNGCCRDDLTVSLVEAAAIVVAHGPLLREEGPGPRGGCAMLGADGGCRVYDARPYVCRTQGLPLRWIDEPTATELRDICPENAEGTPLEELAPSSCWTLGAAELVLAAIGALVPRAHPGEAATEEADRRIPLRALFERSMVSPSAVGASEFSFTETPSEETSDPPKKRS